MVYSDSATNRCSTVRQVCDLEYIDIRNDSAKNRCNTFRLVCDLKYSDSTQT
ncbi:hypothetical protein CHS0354_042988, partial [Potamilus streckersoni]